MWYFPLNRYLISFIGDDGLVRVWNMDDFWCEQVLQGNKWGQVTTLAWVFEDQTTDGKITRSIGTGRGLSCLCPMSAGSTVHPFLPNIYSFCNLGN